MHGFYSAAAFAFSSFSFLAADFTFSALGLLAALGFFTEPLGLPLLFFAAPSSFFAGAMMLEAPDELRDPDKMEMLIRTADLTVDSSCFLICAGCFASLADLVKQVSAKILNTQILNYTLQYYHQF